MNLELLAFVLVIGMPDFEPLRCGLITRHKNLIRDRGSLWNSERAIIQRP